MKKSVLSFFFCSFYQFLILFHVSFFLLFWSPSPPLLGWPLLLIGRSPSWLGRLPPSCWWGGLDSRTKLGWTVSPHPFLVAVSPLPSWFVSPLPLGWAVSFPFLVGRSPLPSWLPLPPCWLGEFPSPPRSLPPPSPVGVLPPGCLGRLPSLVGEGWWVGGPPLHSPFLVRRSSPPFLKAVSPPFLLSVSPSLFLEGSPSPLLGWVVSPLPVGWAVSFRLFGWDVSLLLVWWKKRKKKKKKESNYQRSQILRAINAQKPKRTMAPVTLSQICVCFWMWLRQWAELCRGNSNWPCRQSRSRTFSLLQNLWQFDMDL